MPASPRTNPAVTAPAQRRGVLGAIGRLTSYLTGSGSPASTSPTSFGANYGQIFQGATGDRSLKPWPVTLLDTNRALTNPTWRAMLSHSRRLFANLGAVHGAVCERARLVVGQAWQPLYTGRNHAWGVKAAAWLTQWMKVCDVRGGPYDFRTALKLMSVALDRDGDFGVVLVNDNPLWPHIQLIPAHRIASRLSNNDCQVTDGPYKGYWLNNGVISNDFGRTLALNVLGPVRGTDSGWALDRQISTFDMIHHFRPEWSDQGRGIPSFSSVLRDLRHMSDLRDLELQAAAAQGTESLIVANDTGEAEPAYDEEADPEADGESGKLTLETLAGGTIRYVRGGSGNDIKAFTTTRPSPAWIGLMDHLERASLAAIGWPKEYALDMSRLGGATARAILNKCQYSIDERQDDLFPVASRIVCWAIAVAIKNGILEPDPDWYLWDFQLPGELSVDDGNDRSNDRDDLRAGLTNKRRIYGRRGLNHEIEQAQRKKEVSAVLTDAEDILKEHPDWTKEAVLNLLESNTPNGLQAAKPATPADDTAVPKKKAA